VHVESFTSERLGARRISDTTLYGLLRRLEPGPLRKRLWTQVRGLARSKSLRPADLPCGVLAVDGKGIWTLQHDAGVAPRSPSRTMALPTAAAGPGAAAA
jgi:hypothetical protein